MNPINKRAMKNLKGTFLVKGKNNKSIVFSTSFTTKEENIKHHKRWSDIWEPLKGEKQQDWITSLGYKSIEEIRPYSCSYMPNIFNKPLKKEKLKYIHLLEIEGYKVINKQR